MDNEEKVEFSLLLASSIHDIKNSLGMLLNSLEDLVTVDEISEPEQKKHYLTLRSEASRINNALIYLLGLYHLDKDKLSVNADEIYVRDFLEEQIASQELLLQIRDIQVELHCEEALTAFFDENLVAGIINNIIVNDIKYTRDLIVIRAAMRDDFLCIEISDNGSGYPDHILENSRDREKQIDFISGSTNLGLYFASEIAGLHHCHGRRGYIELSNGPDSGGIFRLFLP